jgi:hypothetical protein
MAITYIMDFDGGTREIYDAILADMDLGGKMPAHGLFHGAGATDGGWRVVDVWESAEAFDEFSRAKIGPLSAKHGMAPPRVRSFEVANVREGEPGAVTFLQVVTIPGVDAGGFADLDRRVLPDDETPAGCVFHVNGPLADGWCVMDAWTSKAICAEFLKTQVEPAVMAAGITSMPQFENLDLHNSLDRGPVVHA